MSKAMFWTAMALYCGFMCAWGWITVGVPRDPVNVAFCVAGHVLFLSFAVKAASVRWEEKE